MGTRRQIALLKNLNFTKAMGLGTKLVRRLTFSEVLSLSIVQVGMKHLLCF